MEQIPSPSMCIGARKSMEQIPSPSMCIGASNAIHLSQREFPVCEDGGESKVLRSRTIPDRNQFRATPVKAWESTKTLKAPKGRDLTHPWI